MHHRILTMLLLLLVVTVAMCTAQSSNSTLLILYNFNVPAQATSDVGPSFVAPYITGYNFSLENVVDLGLNNDFCLGQGNCPDTQHIVVNSSYIWGFTSIRDCNLTAITFFEGNNDCQNSGVSYCSVGAEFVVEGYPTADTADVSLFGNFTPPTGYLISDFVQDTENYTFPIPSGLSLPAGTSYTFRIRAVHDAASGSAQYTFDDIAVYGICTVPATTTPSPVTTSSVSSSAGIGSPAWLRLPFFFFFFFSPSLMNNCDRFFCFFIFFL